MNDGLAGLVGLGLGRDAQQDRSTGPEGLEALRPDSGLRALTADEALDRPVGEDERLVAGLGRRGPLGQDHAGMHERDAVGAKRLGPLVQCPRAHDDPYSTAMSTRTLLPWIARHTLAGVSGMSA